MHIETLNLQSVGSGAVAAAVGGSPLDSMIIKNSKSAPMIVAMWPGFQTTGYFQVTAPSLHDMIRGYRAGAIAAENNARMPLGLSLNPMPQEQLSATVSGSATTVVDTIGMLLLYGDLPGVNSRLTDWKTVRERTVDLTTVSATLSGAATGYTGSEAINAESDLLKANRNYALLGMTTNVTVPTLCLAGPDTGNLRVGVPGDSGDQDGYANWFVTLSRAYGKPMIPVLNSGNKASTFLSFCQNEVNKSPLVTVFLALLD